MLTSNRRIDIYIEKYRHKATVLKLIHSDKAESKRKWDLRYTVATIVLGALITFLGFMGPDRIFEMIFWSSDASSHSSKQVLAAMPSGTSAASQPSASASTPGVGTISNSKKWFDFFFNSLVLLLFVTSLLNLIYRWKEEHTAHFQSVVRLTKFINWLDELKLLGIGPADVHSLKEIRGRYQSIVEFIPPNDDKDYEVAKTKLNSSQNSTNNSKKIAHAEGHLRANSDLEYFLLELIESSGLIVRILEAARTVNGDLWLGGGAIRNYVWDTLTGRVTPLDDFDIVYFDEKNLNKEQDLAAESKLADILPKGIRISVKNQARMHLTNGEPQRHSLVEALTNWPETATAIAVRIDSRGYLELIAPHGVDDMLNLVIRPTEYHSKHPSSFNKRMMDKKWSSHWPELKIHLPAQ